MEIPQDKRRGLAEALVEYMERCSEAQREVAGRLLEFVCATPDCFERSHAAGHITGSAWLVSPDGGNVLLTLHHKLQKWLQPGGHADGDPDTLRTSLREATEESGITGISPVSRKIWDVDIHTIPARPAAGEPEHLHYDVRYILRAPHTDYTVSAESVRLAWFGFEEIAGIIPSTDESVLRMARLWKEGGIPAK